jgi:hypothetical protein
MTTTFPVTTFWPETLPSTLPPMPAAMSTITEPAFMLATSAARVDQLRVEGRGQGRDQVRAVLRPAHILQTRSVDPQHGVSTPRILGGAGPGPGLGVRRVGEGRELTGPRLDHHVVPQADQLLDGRWRRGHTGLPVGLAGDSDEHVRPLSL